MEVLGYIIVASQEDRHYVANDDFGEVELPSQAGKHWRVPAVLFGKGLKK
jgi:hypothetical protein